MKALKKVGKIVMAPAYATVAISAGIEEIVFKSLGHVTKNDTLDFAGNVAEAWRICALDLMVGKDI